MGVGQVEDVVPGIGLGNIDVEDMGAMLTNERWESEPRTDTGQERTASQCENGGTPATWTRKLRRWESLFLDAAQRTRRKMTRVKSRWSGEEMR